MVRPLKLDSAQFGTKVGRHMLEFHRNPASAEDRAWLMAHILTIYTEADQFREGTFSGQGQLTPQGHMRGPAWFYAKETDVVLTDLDDNFISILKDGTIHNESFRRAKILPMRPQKP